MKKLLSFSFLFSLLLTTSVFASYMNNPNFATTSESQGYYNAADLGNIQPVKANPPEYRVSFYQYTISENMNHEDIYDYQSVQMVFNYDTKTVYLYNPISGTSSRFFPDKQQDKDYVNKIFNKAFNKNFF